MFFLTTGIVQVAAALHKMLVHAYDRAEAAHQSSERALRHISSLYHALEAFNSREDQQQLAEVLAEFTARSRIRTGGLPLAEIELRPVITGKHGLCSTPASPGVEIDWQAIMQQLWARVNHGNEFLVHVLGANSRITARTIVSQGQCFGLLAFWDNNLVNQRYKDPQKTLQFLADLGGITLERFHSDQLWGRLLVSEEQNRISNELHDTIAQYLFSINCALHALSCEDAGLQDERIQEQLKLVRSTAQREATELRSSIYKLNPTQRGESIFIVTLASYLDELGRLTV